MNLDRVLSLDAAVEQVYRSSAYRIRQWTRVTVAEPVQASLLVFATVPSTMWWRNDPSW